MDGKHRSLVCDLLTNLSTKFSLSAATCHLSMSHTHLLRSNGGTDYLFAYNDKMTQSPCMNLNVTTVYVGGNGGISRTPSANIANFAHFTCETYRRTGLIIKPVTVLLDETNDRKR